MKMRRKVKRRRNINRRRRESDKYLVLILLCLLVFNVGTLVYLSIKSDTKIYSLTNNISSLLDINSLNPFKNKNKEVVETTEVINENPEDDEDEFKISTDYILIDKLDEYESLIIIKDSQGISSIENIPEPLNIKKVKVDKETEYILMYHTHATEAFLTEDSGVYHNSDISKNMISVGRVLSKVLEANGHKVDHVETLHDLPSYNNSYNRSLNTINKKKAEKENLKIFLDLHRDGVDNDAAYKDRFLEKARIDINGVSTATFSLVIGPDTPNYESVLSFAKYIKAVSDTLYPNLCTGIIIKPAGKYNLYASDYSALVEVGSNLVTIEEAHESAKLIGEILSLVINSIIE